MTRENANEVVQIKKNDDLKLWEQTLWIWLLGTREFRDLGKRFVIASFWRNGNLTMKNLITKWWGRRGWFSTTRRKAEWHSYEMIKRIFNILKNISHNLRNPTYQKFKNLPGFWSSWSIFNCFLHKEMLKEKNEEKKVARRVTKIIHSIWTRTNPWVDLLSLATLIY